MDIDHTSVLLSLVQAYSTNTTQVYFTVYCLQEPLLLTWINFDSSMDK